MVKSSLLFALLMGLIFAQMIPAHSSDSDSETEDSDEESSNEEENADADEDTADESDGDNPALTCLLFNDLGCNTECSTVASAFSITGTGECVDENICQCTLEQDESLEGLFRAKFNADKALNKIKQDEKLAAQVLEILQVPFQTIDQTKRELRKVVYPAIYDDLLIDDKTPAWELGLVGEVDELDYDKIKKYVSDKLKSVLRSSSSELKKVNYKSELKKSLEGKTSEDKDLQSTIDQVRRTKNENLNDFVNSYLKSANIKEVKNPNMEDIADAIRYQVVDQFINHIEQKKKPVAKKPPTRKPPTKNPANKSKSAGKKTGTSKSSDDEDTKKKSDVSLSSRFELPGFDKKFLDKYAGSIDEIFKTKEYKLHYQRSRGGSIDFDWRTGKDAVNMSISAGNSIHQTWRLGDIKITLDRSAGGAISQNWDFGKTKYMYSKSAGGRVFENWGNRVKDPENLKKYQSLINEWCDANDFLLVKNDYSSTKIPCTIY